MKVGDYARTNTGRIAKITKIIDCEEEGEKPYLNYNDMCVYTIDENFMVAGSRGEIIKSSPNIIDLIEVGDYVNGHRVNYINKDREHFNISFGNEDFNLKSKFNSDIYWLSKEDIKSIVTKEQFESMEYKIGE